MPLRLVMDHTPDQMSRFVVHRKSKASLSVPEPRGPTVLEVFDWSAMMSPYFSPRIAHPHRHPFCRSPRLPRNGNRARYSPPGGNSQAFGDYPTGAEKRPLHGPVFSLDGRTVPKAGKYSPFPSIASHQLSPGGVPVTRGVLPVSSAALPVWPGPLPAAPGSLPVSSSALPVSKAVLPVSSAALPVWPGALPRPPCAFPVSSSALPVSPALTSTTRKSNLCPSTERVTDLNHGTPRRTVKLQLLDSISEEKTHSPRSRGSKDSTPVDLNREGKTNRNQNPGLMEVPKSRTAGPNYTKTVELPRYRNEASDKLTRFSIIKPISPNDGENELAEWQDNVQIVQLRTPETLDVVTQSSKVGLEKKTRERTTVDIYLPRVEVGTPYAESEEEDD